MADAVYKQALDAVAADLANVSITGVDTSSVPVKKLVWDDTVIKHGVTVFWDEEQEGVGTNERDDWAYPCHVAHVQGSSKGWSEDITKISEFRQKVTRRFHEQRRLSAVSDTNTNELIQLVEKSRIDIPQRYRANYDITFLTVWCHFRESRSN